MKSRIWTYGIGKMRGLSVSSLYIVSHQSFKSEIDQARNTWKSKAYDHYEVTLVRHKHRDGSPSKLAFKFTCRTDPHTHKPLFRDRMKTAQGTQNLARAEKACLDRRGVQGDSSAGSQQDLRGSVSKYSPARHRALIALRCAASRRPFNTVADPYYLQEVELLRPGTVVPNPRTVSRDVLAIYQKAAIGVKEYFSVSFKFPKH